MKFGRKLHQNSPVSVMTNNLNLAGEKEVFGQFSIVLIPEHPEHDNVVVCSIFALWVALDTIRYLLILLMHFLIVVILKETLERQSEF